MSRRALPLALATLACAEDPGITRVSSLWRYSAEAKVAPAGVGAEGRVLVALSESLAGGGRVAALKDFDGLPLEGPFDGPPITDHAPIMADARLVLLTKIGGLSAVSLAGDPLFTLGPVGPPSATSPLVLASGTVRWGTAAGAIASVDLEGTERFRAMIGDPVTTPLAVGADGTTYAATDTGRVVALDGAGGIVFDVGIDAPASGPAAGRGAVAVVVGEASGVRALGADGSERWKRPRAARVVGARVSGDLVLAWGEDGKLEGLALADGAVRFEFSTSAGANPAPIYAGPVDVSGAYGIVDASGTAHLLDAAGASLATLPLGFTPGREIVGANQALYVSEGNNVHAIRFIYAKPEG